MLLTLFRNSIIVMPVLIIMFPFEISSEKYIRNAYPRQARKTFVKALLSNSQLTEAQTLAQKLAKNALVSPTMQKTMKQLTSVGAKTENDFLDAPISGRKKKKTKRKKKRKRKRKKKRKQKRVRTNAMRESSRSNRSVAGFGNILRNDRNNVVENKFNGFENESMIADLMKTTTKDPSRGSQGDQGMEYSEYYNLSDVPNHPSKMTRDSNDRINLREIRQANDSSIYDDYPDDYLYDQNSSPYSQETQYEEPMVENFDSRERRRFPPRANFPPRWINRRMRENSKTSTCRIPSGPAAGEKNISIAEEEAVRANGAINETQKVANEILYNIVNRLEDVKSNNNWKNDLREGFPCKLSGTWIATRSGLKIEMRVSNRSIKVNLGKMKQEARPSNHQEGIIDVSWSITGHAPFRLGAPFSLIATNNRTKSLAIFLGACRICQGTDTIQGVWSSVRESRDCRDLPMTMNNMNDIFRRTA